MPVRTRRFPAAVVVVAFLVLAGTGAAQPAPPSLTAPVNDFAQVIDPESARAMDALIRSLQQASGDVVVVATVDTFAPYGTIDDYAVKMFENGGRGVGARGRDNGLLILAAMKDRRVKIEVGYELEQFITDGFAGQTIREDITPEFRSGNYGAGLLAATNRIVSRIAERRNVTLQGVPVAPPRRSGGGGSGFPIIIIIMIILLLGRIGRRRRRRGWGGPWSGWSSGVGPFGGFGGGGFGGGGFGGGGGGFGGGFGGFGGGRSGGGGASGGW